MSPRAVRLLFAAALAASATAASASHWIHPEFAARRPEKLVVLAPEANIVRGKVNDAEPMIKETAALEQALTRGVASVLSARGYTVDATSLSPEALNADRELQDSVMRVQARVDELLGPILDKPRSLAEGRFSIGDLGLPIAAATGADGLLVLRSQAIIPSKGSRALTGVLSTLLGGIPHVPTTKVMLISTLVDARTGLIQWVGAEVTSGPVLKNPEQVAGEIVLKSFERYPRQGETVRLTKREKRAAENAPPPPEPVEVAELDPAQVVADFERAAAAQPADASEHDGEEPVPPAAPWSADERPVSVREGLREGEAPPPAQPSAAAAPQPTDSTARTLFDVPADRRPAAELQPAIQLADGPTGVHVRNESGRDIRVSLDAGPWTDLGSAQELSLPMPAGSHWLLVSSPDGRELLRTFVLIGEGRVARIELRPLAG